MHLNRPIAFIVLFKNGATAPDLSVDGSSVRLDLKISGQHLFAQHHH